MLALRSGPSAIAATFFCLTIGASPIVVFTFGNFVGPLSREFGWTRAILSDAFALGAVSAAIMAPVIGRLIDRRGLRPVTLAGLVIAAILVAAQALNTGSVVLLFVIQAAIGACTIVLTPIPYAKAITGWYDRNRGLALGIAALGGAVGAAIIPQIAQAVIAASSWRAAYLVLGGLVLVAGFLPALLLLHERPRRPVRAGGTPPRGLSTAEGRRSWRLWLICLVMLLGAAGTAGPIGQLVPLLLDSGVPIATATGVIGAFALANAASRFVSGVLLDRLYAPRLAAVAFSAAAIGVLLLALAPSLSIAFIAAALCGVAAGFEADLLPFLVSRYVGGRAFGELVGYAYLCFTLGTGMVGPLLMGNAHTYTGSYAPALVVLTVGLLAASGLLLLLGPYAFPPAREAEDGAAPLPAAPKLSAADL